VIGTASRARSATTTGVRHLLDVGDESHEVDVDAGGADECGLVAVRTDATSDARDRILQVRAGLRRLGG
jgi:hypothetical protein